MKELTILPNQPMKLPAHLSHLAAATADKDLTDGVGSGFAVLKFKGKVWSVQKGDMRQPILNADGDPQQSIDLVLVKANRNVTKTYYAKGFTEGDNARPVCWSNDGKRPSANVENPVCQSCESCPNNVIGSRVGDDGIKMKACSDNRRIAVLNLSYVDPEGDAPRLQLLRLPYNSMKNLADFGRTLSSQGAPYNAVVAKVGFDMTKAFPLVTFSARHWMSEQEAALVAQLSSDASALDSILGDVEFTAPAPAGVASTFDADAEAAAPAKAAAKPAAAPAKPKPAAAPAKPKPAAAPVVEADVPPPAPAARAPETLDHEDAPAATGDTDDDIGALLAEFDD